MVKYIWSLSGTNSSIVEGIMNAVKEQSSLKILHLGDDILDTGFIASAFSDRGIACDIFRVDKHKDFIETIQEGGFDVIFTSTLPSVDRVFAGNGEPGKSCRYTIYFHFMDKVEEPAE